ncbi:uncharacterized protein LOC119550379 [Drosophila subpulchrella]|uniref:uncharacterized protein LOC119550379 n=1 Tax=Drosophila subpulchrella TaxID=1486046 RepID=UPI0018A1AAF8|nr:uncharacterized protein LOC119550379 [Drosophila subpulchrella]
MSDHMSVALGLVCPTELILGEIVDVGLCVKCATAAGLAATDVGARAETVKANEMEARPGLGEDVVLQEAQDADTAVAALDKIRAEVQTVVVHHYIPFHGDADEGQWILRFATEAQQTLPHHDCLLVCSPFFIELYSQTEN